MKAIIYAIVLLMTAAAVTAQSAGSIDSECQKLMINVLHPPEMVATPPTPFPRSLGRQPAE